MAGDGIGKVTKYSTLVLTTLFFLSGIILIAIGAHGVRAQVVGLSSTTVAVGVIVLGVFLSIISFVGFIGFLRESRLFIVIYFLVVLIFAVIELCLAIAAIVGAEKIPSVAYNSWKSLYYNDPTAIEDIEKTFQCCGWSSVTDYAQPDNCVVTFKFQSPCATEVQKALEDALAPLGAMAAVIATLQLLTLIFSIVAIRYARKKAKPSRHVELRDDYDDDGLQDLDG